MTFSPAEIQILFITKSSSSVSLCSRAWVSWVLTLLHCLGYCILTPATRWFIRNRWKKPCSSLNSISSSLAPSENMAMAERYSPWNSKIYVLHENRVQILNSDTTFYSTFRKQGSGEGSMWDSLWQHWGGHMVDSGNHHIQVFTVKQVFLRMFGK